MQVHYKTIKAICGFLHAGSHTIELDVSDLPGGIYQCEINLVDSGRLLIAK